MPPVEQTRHAGIHRGDHDVPRSDCCISNGVAEAWYCDACAEATRKANDESNETATDSNNGIGGPQIDTASFEEDPACPRARTSAAVPSPPRGASTEAVMDPAQEPATQRAVGC